MTTTWKGCLVAAGVLLLATSGWAQWPGGPPIGTKTCNVVEDNPQFSVDGATAELDFVSSLLDSSGGGPLTYPALGDAKAALNRAEAHLVQLLNHWALNQALTCRICDLRLARRVAGRLASLSAAVHGEQGWHVGIRDSLRQEWSVCTPEQIRAGRQPGVEIVVNLSGAWVCEVNCSFGVGRVARIAQEGGALELTNEGGMRSRGRFLSAAEIVASQWGNLRATVTDGGNTIRWANGTIWRRSR